MNKKKAVLKYKSNNFDILEDGDHVVCAVSKKLIPLENLNYWNVDLQEPYFSPIEAKIKNDELKKKKITTSNDCETKSTDQGLLISFFQEFYLALLRYLIYLFRYHHLLKF